MCGGGGLGGEDVVDELGVESGEIVADGLVVGLEDGDGGGEIDGLFKAMGEAGGHAGERVGEAWDCGVVREPIVMLNAGGELLHARGHVGVAFFEGGVGVGDEMVEIVLCVVGVGIVGVVREGGPICGEEVVVEDVDEYTCKEGVCVG